MSVLLGSAKSDEWGNIIGGRAGDQTGNEVGIDNYYVHKKGWYVLRPISEEVANKIASNMQAACDNPNIGYDQGQNTSLYSISKSLGFDCSKVTTPCEVDCARLVRVCILYAGIEVEDFYTASLKSAVMKTKQFLFFDSDAYCKSSSLLKRGDILVTRTKGHTVVVLSNGDGSGYAGEQEQQVEISAEAIASLYDVEVTKEDATLREVGYINGLNQPSIQESQIKLTAINYTNLLGDLFSMYTPKNITAVTATVETNIDAISNTVAKACMVSLLTFKLNAAVCCGILGNIKHESNFDAGAKGDKRNGVYTSFGLCQWHNNRGVAMKLAAGPKWETNVTGQMNYLWTELQVSYESVLSSLEKLPNTRAGAEDAAEIFVRKFEVPANVEKQVIIRRKSAGEFWDCIVNQQV